MFRWVPGFHVASSYQSDWLAQDVIAGVVLTTLLVPQGMAYAELAGLPPITGLYTSILCLLGYAVFGPSRILVLGPDAEPVTDVDTTAADVLINLDETLNARGVSLVFAELKDPVRDKIARYGLTRTVNPRHFYPTVGAAIDAFRDETGANWPATGDGARTEDGQGPALTGGNRDGERPQQQ